ncbi:MAG: AzlD domain-containing protein [Stappiaceae bacterium]
MSEILPLTNAWWPYIAILIGGWFATDIWRFLGVFAAGKLREDSEILLWVRAVATALVAGVIARLILFPTGFLSETPMGLRVGAAIAGFVCFKLSRDRLLPGIAVAEMVLIGGWLLFFAP